MREEQIEAIKTFVCENIETPFLHDKIVENFYYSKWYLSNEFKRITGMPVGEFIRQKQFEKAKEYIEHGMTWKEAAKTVGIKKECNFWFIKKYYMYFGEKPIETERRIEHAQNNTVG